MMRAIDVDHLDALNHGLSKLRALLMSLHGCASLNEDDRDALTTLCGGSLEDFERVERTFDSEGPCAPAAALAA